MKIEKQEITKTIHIERIREYKMWIYLNYVIF